MNNLERELKKLRSIFKADIIVIIGVSKSKSFIMRVETKEGFEDSDDEPDFPSDHTKAFSKKESLINKDSYIG